MQHLQQVLTRSQSRKLWYYFLKGKSTVSVRKFQGPLPETTLLHARKAKLPKSRLNLIGAPSQDLNESSTEKTTRTGRISSDFGQLFVLGGGRTVLLGIDD